MAYQIVLKKRYLQSVNKVAGYLEKEWSKKVASDFILKIDHRLEQLITNPELGSLSEKVKNVRDMLITRHNRMYYKIKGQKVIVLNLYDTRMNPRKNPY